MWVKIDESFTTKALIPDINVKGKPGKVKRQITG